MTVPTRRRSTDATGPRDHHARDAARDAASDTRVDAETAWHRDGPFETAELTRVFISTRGRALLECLLEATPTIDLHTLIGRLADAEHDPTIETSIHGLRQRIHVSLRQTYLPVLESHGLIVYDDAESRIALTPRFERYRAYLEARVPDSSAG